MNSNRGRQSYLVVSVSEVTVTKGRFIANLTPVSIAEVTSMCTSHVKQPCFSLCFTPSDIQRAAHAMRNPYHLPTHPYN